MFQQCILQVLANYFVHADEYFKKFSGLIAKRLFQNDSELRRTRDLLKVARGTRTVTISRFGAVPSGRLLHANNLDSFVK